MRALEKALQLLRAETAVSVAAANPAREACHLCTDWNTSHDDALDRVARVERAEKNAKKK